MKSTKYQLLQADFDLALKDIRLRNERIRELEEQNEKLKRYSKSLEYDSEKLAILNVQLQSELELCKEVMKENGIILRKDYEKLRDEGKW